MEQVAKSAGLGAVYDVYYRALSNDAAHPSFTALKRYYEVDEKNDAIKFLWGPEVRDVKETLIASCAACLQLVTWMAECVEHPEITERLRQCFEELKRLTEGGPRASAGAVP